MTASLQDEGCRILNSLYFEHDDPGPVIEVGNNGKRIGKV